VGLYVAADQERPDLARRSEAAAWPSSAEQASTSGAVTGVARRAELTPPLVHHYFGHQASTVRARACSYNTQYTRQCRVECGSEWAGKPRSCRASCAKCK